MTEAATFQYTDSFQLKTFGFPIAFTALTFWLAWNATLPVRVMLAIFWLVLAINAALIITSPFRFEVIGDTLTAGHYGGITREWHLSDLTVSDDSVLASLLTALEVKASAGNRAFLIFRPLPRLNELLALLGAAKP